MLSTSGVIASLQVCPGHGVPMEPVDPAVFVTAHGLEGDRHARAGSRRQVLLIEQETLEAMRLKPGIVKENVTTRGIDLTSLPPDARLAIGEKVELWITGPCNPCALLDEVRAGLQEEIRGRRGTLAWVKNGGPVSVGDKIRVKTD